MRRIRCCGGGCSGRPKWPDWLVGALLVFFLLVMGVFLVILIRTAFAAV